jgi:hypothetical protein
MIQDRQSWRSADLLNLLPRSRLLLSGCSFSVREVGEDLEVVLTGCMNASHIVRPETPAKSGGPDAGVETLLEDAWIKLSSALP